MTWIIQHWNLFRTLVLLLGAAWIAGTAWINPISTGGAVPAPKQGFLAPDFELQTLDGNTVRLSDLKQPALINVWASWCPPCKAEMPAMERVYQAYREQGFTILAINATNQDSLADARGFVDQYGLSFPILIDPDGQTYRKYQVQALPTSFFVDRDGIIRELVVGGPMSEALLRSQAEQLLQGAP